MVWKTMSTRNFWTFEENNVRTFKEKFEGSDTYNEGYAVYLSFPPDVIHRRFAKNRLELMHEMTLTVVVDPQRWCK